MGSIALNVESKTGRCAFGRILDRHADAEDLEAVNDPTIPHTDIHEAVTEHYEPVGITTVKLHRRGKCACKRSN
jgi:hypothetical protein